MCLAFPGKIQSIDGTDAVVDYGDILKKANVSFIDCEAGDWILVHVGFAIEKVDATKAKEMYNLLGNLPTDGATPVINN